MNMNQLYLIFPNHYNGAEGIHDFGDFCKFGHVCQAKGGTGQAQVPMPPLKQTNKQISFLKCSVNKTGKKNIVIHFSKKNVINLCQLQVKQEYLKVLGCQYNL